MSFYLFIFLARAGGTGTGATYCRRYDVTVRLQPPRLVKRAFGVRWATLAKVLKNEFYARLVSYTQLLMFRSLYTPNF